MISNKFSPMPLLEGSHASSVPCPISFDTQQVHESHSIDHNLQQEVVLHQQEFIDKLMNQGSSNFPISFPTDNPSNIMVEESLCDQYNVRGDDQWKKSGKWMSSKMRIMRKMMSPDIGAVTKKPGRSKQLLQDQQPRQSTQANNTNSYPSDGVVRVCSDCNTTTTPLWRSGPSGPKSLCNACGIRQRKARRALAAAAAVSSGLIPAAAVAANKVRRDRDSDVDRTVPFKKRRRFSTAGGVAHKKLCFDDIVIRLSKSSAFHRVFPQDEKEAAILLMALSCGLMCS